MKSYITLDQIHNSEYGFIDEIYELEKTNASFVSSLLSVVSSIINTYVGHDFNCTEKTISLDGDGSSLIMLDTPAVTLDYVTLDDDTNHPVILDNTYFELKDNGKKILLKNGTKTTDGICNITINGVFGYKEVPKDVLQSCVLLANSYCELLSDSEQLGRIVGPYQSEKIGNYSYALKSSINSITGDNINTTGNPIVDKILDKYREKISIGVV